MWKASKRILKTKSIKFTDKIASKKIFKMNNAIKKEREYIIWMKFKKLKCMNKIKRKW